ncbi:MAG: preprotein translocase subunit SecE [Gammaproteobacteria bacterium RIFCSPHIGHO2_12_FULL_45_9]|nr:MAG: preprotein translocase subunit SecE [Gammaproteobacteria bacterium RIFCSPHIGHO2_12_FULL_45_9]
MTELKQNNRPNGANGKSSNIILWIIVVILIAGGIIANFHYESVAWAIRTAIGIVLFAVVLGMASRTTQGQQAWSFIKGSRTELRKVVWPTRQETVQTTLVVAVMVIITALVLWGFDSLFLWIIGWLTGQRG